MPVLRTTIVEVGYNLRSKVYLTEEKLIRDRLELRNRIQRVFTFDSFEQSIRVRDGIVFIASDGEE